MTNSSTSRRKRWPRYTEEARAEAEELAKEGAAIAAYAAELNDRARDGWKRQNDTAAELQDADSSTLMRQASAMLERIHRLMVEAKQGKEAESETKQGSE